MGMAALTQHTCDAVGSASHVRVHRVPPRRARGAGKGRTPRRAQRRAAARATPATHQKVRGHGLLRRRLRARSRRPQAACLLRGRRGRRLDDGAPHLGRHRAALRREKAGMSVSGNERSTPPRGGRARARRAACGAAGAPACAIDSAQARLTSARSCSVAPATQRQRPSARFRRTRDCKRAHVAKRSEDVPAQKAQARALPAASSASHRPRCSLTAARACAHPAPSAEFDIGARAAQWNRPARRAARRRETRWAARPRQTSCTARARATTSRRCVRRLQRGTALRCTRLPTADGSLSTRRRVQTRRTPRPVCWCVTGAAPRRGTDVCGARRMEARASVAASHALHLTRSARAQEHGADVNARSNVRLAALQPANASASA